MFKKETCPYCLNTYSKRKHEQCPFCDGIDFENIKEILIVKESEEYHEEIIDVFDPLMTYVLT